MTKFKVGDVVYLKSDLNQKMTVMGVDGGGVTCVWFGLDKRMFIECLVPETLMLDIELKKLKAKWFKIDKHCKEVEESNRELRDKVSDLENRNKYLIRDKEDWINLYNGVASRYREYRDWLIDLKMIESSPETPYSKTRESGRKSGSRKMEKTNKCSVQYVCWGSKETCKYWVEGLVPFNTHYYIVCKWYLEGICTCKEAQKEAVEYWTVKKTEMMDSYEFSCTKYLPDGEE